MSDHFNELLLQTLKEVGVRLERLEGRVDHVINEKSDKEDVRDVKTELKSVNEKLDQKADKAALDSLRDEVRSNGQRLDRLAAGIKTLQWTVTAGIAALGVLIALLKAF